jgi:hypothetical protein
MKGFYYLINLSIIYKGLLLASAEPLRAKKLNVFWLVKSILYDVFIFEFLF